MKKGDACVIFVFLQPVDMKKILTIFFFSTLWSFALAQGTVRYDIEPEIVRIQEDYISNWRKVGEINGYRIQIAAYSGVNSKSQAEYAKNSFNNLFPYTKAYLIYNEPYFKVRVGNYFTRLQAYKDLETIKLTYPSAYIVPDKISYR
jgi:hypothetical protein